MKHLVFLCLFALVACATNTSLHDHEKALIGNWMLHFENGQMQGMYYEFHEDRTGIYGPVVKVNGKIGIMPHLQMMIKDWKIQNDTLSMQMESEPGLVYLDGNGKELEQSDKPSIFRYFVKEVSDTVIVLEDPDLLGGEFGGAKLVERLKRSEKVGYLNR